MSMQDAMDTIMERDRRDAGRDIAPLVRAPDALLIDSSRLSIEDVRNTILDFVRNDP